jgi:hypothetical protein
VTSDLLFADLRATSSIVDGYWLSFGALVHCASCGNEEPHEMVGLLDRAAQEGS